jgi:hypothetical protein
MNYQEYRDFCKLVEKQRVVFYYFGYFSQNIVSAMAEAVRVRLEQSEKAASTRRKLFSSFVEMAQNIIHYSSNTLTPPEGNDKELRQGSLCIGGDSDRYYLHCANPVADGDVDGLKSRLESLRSMTLDEIKRAYRETLRSDQPEGSKGAGLGFLTVARDASEPLEFEFTRDDHVGTTMFYLKATI